MTEVCRYCPNECVDAEPTTVDGEPIIYPSDIILCSKWTCMWGKRKGKRALNNGEFETLILLDGNLVEGAPFGSADKPTEEGEFRRYVTKTGAIIANNADGELYYTGQNVHTRRA